MMRSPAATKRPDVQRRKFLQSLTAFAVAAAAGLRSAMAFSRSRTSFRHGVASGDPTDSAVIIWTRISTASGQEREVNWQVATDAAVQHVVAKGSVSTGPWRDFTVKADVTGLAPGRQYFYRFISDGQTSPVGRTRTLPVGDVARAKLAVVSCSNHPAGFFNVYREIALQDDLDAVVHLGDYIYEYGPGQYATEHAESLGRVPEPPHEVVTLADYRLRHAQYKADADCIHMHSQLPMIAIWDDHEIANDTWKCGAQNHQQDEGEWPQRRDAALQAWYEWMPVRGEPNGGRSRIFRTFRFGKLAELIMLDTRLFGRDAQPDVGETVTAESVGAALRDPGRRMLGAEQEAWLRSRLQASPDTTWQLIGQQVMVASMAPPDLGPLVDPDGPSYFDKETLAQVIERSKSHAPQILDVWEGYPAARADFLRDIAALAKNPVVLSGDLHAALAADLATSPGETPMAVEMMTTSVTSPGLSVYFPDRKPNGVRDATLAQNPHLRFLDIEQRGWLCLTVTPAQCTGEWHLVDTVLSRDYRSRLVKTLRVEAGRVGQGLT